MKYVVGLSGGVDSSYAAYLLKKAGHDVIGCHMRTFDTEGGRNDEDASAEVADHLGIPLFVAEKREDFRKEVIARFAADYAAGRTPNPCVVCNTRVKWQALYECMLKEGADAVATGHYAEVFCDPLSGRCCVRNCGSEKDQSYALYALTQEQIKRTEFPLKGMEKNAVREGAKRVGIPVAAKPDSMDICFIPDNDYVGFLREHCGIIDCPGNFVDVNGNILGTHRGVAHYTVGQRKGLGIALGKRAFVKEIRPAVNEVVLADGEDVFSEKIFVKDMRFQLADPCLLRSGDGLFAERIKIRYGDGGAPGTLYAAGTGDDMQPLFRIEFERPVRAAAPGQAAVLYDKGGCLLAGGTIAGEDGI